MTTIETASTAGDENREHREPEKNWEVWLHDSARRWYYEKWEKGNEGIINTRYGTRVMLYDTKEKAWAAYEGILAAFWANSYTTSSVTRVDWERPEIEGERTDLFDASWEQNRSTIIITIKKA